MCNFRDNSRGRTHGATPYFCQRKRRLRTSNYSKPNGNYSKPNRITPKKPTVMKRRTLLALAIALASTGGMAHNLHDVAYTERAKFRIISENLVSQEAFETDYGADVNLEAKCDARSYYYVSYDIKAGFGTKTRTSSGKKGEKNSYRVCLVSGENETTDISRTQYYYEDRWKTVAYAFVAAAGSTVKIDMTALLTGDSVRNVCIHKAAEIGDERPLLEEIARMESLVSRGDIIINYLDDFEETLGLIKAQLDEPVDKPTLADLKDLLNSVYSEVMESNSVDMKEWVTNLDFDGITPSSKQQIPTGWSVTGDRWMCRSADYDANFSTTPFVQRSIPWKYSLGEAKIWKTASLPAGKYLFTMKAGAWRYINSIGEYDFDYSLDGLKLFANNDTVTWPVCGSDWGRKISVVTEIKDGEQLVIGMMNTASDANLIGYDDGELRLIGKDYSDVTAWMDSVALADKRSDLQTLIDSARVMLSSDYYMWGKTRLNDSVAVYAASIASDDLALLNHDTKNLRGEIGLVHTLNKEYKPMYAELENCRALYADETCRKGKAELGAAIGNAEDFIAKVDKEVRDSAGCVNQYDLLIAAQEAFERANRPETQKEAELYPIADTEIAYADANTNFGQAALLNCGAWKESWSDTSSPGLKNDSYKSISIFKFNVKDYTKHIIKAKFTVTAYNNNAKNRSIYIGACTVNDWEEDSITAGNSGIVTRGSGYNIRNFSQSKSVALGGAAQTVEFDTENLMDWLNTQADENGMVTLMIYGVGQNCTVASRESDTKPALWLVYDSSVDTAIGAVATPKAQPCDNTWYNLQGQRVEKPSKGIYIRGGKKVAVK